MEAQAYEDITLTVDGVKCVGCLKKIYAIAEQTPGCTDLQVDMSHHLMKFKGATDLDLDGFQKELASQGFTSRRLKIDQLKQDRTRRKEQLFLIRLGLAGVSAGNIMLLSFALYAGAESSEQGALFSWLCFALSLPVVFFCAWPFYQNSIQALKLRRPSIDLPLAIAIFFGFILSTYNLIQGATEIYFDSIATLTFLLLASRFLVFQIQQRHLAPVQIQDLLSSKDILKISEADGSSHKVPLNEVQEGDLIWWRQGFVLPVDGRIESGAVDGDTSILTGESVPSTFNTHDKVFAGTKLLSPSAKVRVTKALDQTRINQLFRKLEKILMEKTPLTSLTDKAAQVLTVLVISTSLSLVSYFAFTDISEGINRVLALLVLACPCALAVATPLAISLANRRALQKSLLIKSADAFERMNSVETVIFDKTGTLSTGQLKVTQWFPSSPTLEQRRIIFELEEKSEHPIARALLRAVGPVSRKSNFIERYEERPGVGVFGYIGDTEYSIQKINTEFKLDVSNTQVGLFKNNKLLLTAEFSDEVTEQTKEVVQYLKDEGLDLYLLTGDQKGPAIKTGMTLGFPEDRIHYALTPESKEGLSREIAKKGPTLFIGDGVNDSIAMAASDIGISIFESVESTFQSSDVHILSPGLKALIDFRLLSKRLLRVIRFNLGLSLVYNSTFGVLAVLGFVTPLFAAIIMPLSSITVVGVCFLSLAPRGESQS